MKKEKIDTFGLDNSEKVSVREIVKKNLGSLIICGVTLLVLVFLSLFRIATSSTINSLRLEDYVEGHIAFNDVKALKDIPADDMNPVFVQKGEKVIEKGLPITHERYEKLRKMAESPSYIDGREFANSILFLLLLALLCFLLFGKNCLGKKIELNEVATLCVFLVAVFSVTILEVKTPFFQSEWNMCILIPAAFCSFLIAIIFGQRDATFFSIIMSMAVFISSHYMYIPALFVLASSLAATKVVWKIEKRIDLFVSSLLLALVNAVILLMLNIIFNTSDDQYSKLWQPLLGVAFNGFLSGILVLGLLTPIEILLNTASVFRLMELSDLNSPTMKKMLVTCGGTYNHSMMVASLAEAACREIGANSLIARVGAYYHDIGKMDQPEYFVENQNGQNLHDNINPNLSVSIIRSHVKKGTEKAHQLRLPKQVISIIGEHHGDQVISYFYNEAKEKDPNVSIEDFRYNGNPPSTRESAVVMLADTVEAACRTLEKPSVSRLEKFIKTLVDSKIEHNQLDNCDITFKDLDLIQKVFVQILASYYHSRIQYPDQKDPDQKERETAEKQTVSEPEKKTEKKTETADAVEKKTGTSASVEKKTEKAVRNSKNAETQGKVRLSKRKEEKKTLKNRAKSSKDAKGGR